ncbi:putative Phage integrase family protein [Candidatus Terasakiella magnetica]|uniref:Putative Phage integrase family protein n=1 Tax=Candidatus Terasakiella magnetica TaxID=1867952 RepID=A0A1C3RHG9_9PROT|nr:tyrosine-type recombinase/integrase [Candidatus Terasakiella magnetica]SCA56726.1 putative Phage integrase family protein [Candidatus Terasakiella magnetica]
MLREIFDTFLRQSKHERGLSTRTLEGYDDSLHLFLKFLNKKDCTLAELNTELVRNFLFHGREERNWAARTYRIHHSNLNVFCKWLVVNSYSKDNPLERIQKPKLSRPIVKALELKEVHKILYAALLKSSRNPFLRLRNHALIMLPLHTGLRLSEVINLHIADLNLSEKLLHVRNGKGAKDRMVVMTDELISIIHMYLLEHEKNYQMGNLIVFPSKSGKKLTPREFRRITDHIGKLASVKFASHDLRRTYATSLSRNNVSPFIMQQQLGHSDIRVTMRYVCHNQTEAGDMISGVTLY